MQNPIQSSEIHLNHDLLSETNKKYYFILPRK